MSFIFYGYMLECLNILKAKKIKSTFHRLIYIYGIGEFVRTVIAYIIFYRLSVYIKTQRSLFNKGKVAGTFSFFPITAPAWQALMFSRERSTITPK